jgi:hypothetical protein
MPVEQHWLFCCRAFSRGPVSGRQGATGKAGRAAERGRGTVASYKAEVVKEVVGRGILRVEVDRTRLRQPLRVKVFGFLRFFKFRSEDVLRT